jgi:hypothetical protein
MRTVVPMRKTMICEWQNQKDLMLDLLLANPKLTGAQALDYAVAIIAAGQIEDYLTMQQLIQEAIFGPGKRESAA